MGKIKGKKSLEFLTIMMTVIGTMIGAGIYFKNDNTTQHVLGEMHNPFVALIGWAVIGVVVISAMMVFLEVASATAQHGNGTVSNWSRLFTSRKWASVVSVYYIVAYLPVNYAFFSVLVIEYIINAAASGQGLTTEQLSQQLGKGKLLAIYLLTGLFFMVIFGWMNTYQRNTGKQIEIVGTIVKFIPLILVLIAIFIPDKEWGVMFHHYGPKDDYPNKDNGGIIWSTSLSGIKGIWIFSGFAPILFAFNGFIYAANMQKETKNKDVVGKGILVGLIFTTIFYILISLALFMGSKDGSIESFFEYMFSGFKSGEVSDSVKNTANLFSNIILVVVAIMGLNSYTLTGTNFYNTDANEGIIYSGNKFTTQGKSGMIQLGLGIICFVVLIPLAIYTGKESNPGYYMDMAGNAGTIMGYTAYTIIIIGAMVNRFTNKVKVKKLNNWVFWICSVFSVIAMGGIAIFSYLSFFGVFHKLGGDPLDAGVAGAMGVQLGLIVILWVVNEILLKKKPFDRKSVEAQEKKYVSKIRAKEKAHDKKIESIKYLKDQKAKVSKEFNTIIKANRKQKAPKADVKLFIELKHERLDEFDRTIKQVKRK